MEAQRKYRVVVSGGGTGGHIFPALAIADGIRKTHPQTRILFVGAKGRMEMTKVPAAGYEIVGLDVEGLSRSSKLKNMAVLVKFVLACLKAVKILRSFKPDFVVGVGGYASSAVLKAASWLKIPIIIQEQNSYPGKTNKFLAKNAKAICVAYNNLDKYFPAEKLFLTGNPVREIFYDLKKKNDDAFAYFNIKNDKKVILIVGGSQGALSINKTIAENVPVLAQSDVMILWQVGKYFHPEAVKVLEKHQCKNIKCYEFIDRMDYAYSVADLVVSRAGAIAISELCVVGLPAILVPLPTAAENHQMKNAEVLAENNAAIIVEDKYLKEKLIDTMTQVIDNEAKLQSLHDNILRLAVTDSVDKIVSVIEDKVL